MKLEAHGRLADGLELHPFPGAYELLRFSALILILISGTYHDFRHCDTRPNIPDIACTSDLNTFLPNIYTRYCI